ncbi:predicted protein [Scheffersomyces stipitis CBS 6054]|uniref:DNA mismatch repair protein S5 domain-containing protein n=1 Tax=Scheffersomyces stipitis (strain ATCC 58785 / CBS 6054 / NBRC 10063 / NRRL Y-11545) TaxID=322104 RepID=A3LSY2_PICST|nr:predicted protein [Scheffersomyces stipitis CBS 6054]ABN66315.2 predicted protein [Scheffersomyces stipitis CBS 6054]
MPIQRLSESVINRIAAGEIIIQPVNALKEMLENSIDAGASSIDIVVKDGGTKLLQIADNGHGIAKEDLPLLCERFATSKLSRFEDLESIQTYGFRGEALASISHIARLSVVTKTATSAVAYKAFYANGKLSGQNFKSSANTEPKPVAGKVGTQITVEDLFYNLPQRLKGLKSKSDEFSRILDVIGRYAIHCKDVGFSCKKHGEPYQILSTRAQLPIKERIRTIFGNSIATDILEVDLDTNIEKEYGTDNSKYGLISVTGAITNSNYNNKKRIPPVFFINNRLVACEPLKRAVSGVYQFFLPKGSYPFIYLSLQIDAQNVDVNIHPTKREVRFLHEEEIIELIVDKVHLILSSVDTSRKFKTQTILSNTGTAKRPIDEFSALSTQSQKKYRQENKLVRVDRQQTKLSAFIAGQSETSYKESILKETKRKEDKSNEQIVEELEESDKEVDEAEDTETTNTSDIDTKVTTNSRRRVRVSLDSIIELRKQVNEEVHRPLTDILNNAVYVGIVDEEKRLCCFQYDVKLYLCDYASLLHEFYYQVALYEFCNYGEILLSESIPLEDILSPLYAEEREKTLIDKDTIIDTIWAMRNMFAEYFRIGFVENSKGTKCLQSLPMLVKDVKPAYPKLPYFIYRLGNRINYNDEKECLGGIMRQISLLYVPEPIFSGSSDPPSDPSSDPSKADTESSSSSEARQWLDHTLEDVLFPQIKTRFLAPSQLMKDVVQIADLPGLYRVFERC